jgi:hypothetical protein
MPVWLISLIGGGLIGAFLGRWIARGSVARKPIAGGSGSRLFHYLGCAAITAAPFAGAIGGLLASDLHLIPRLLLTSALGFGCVGVSAACLLVFAAFESRAA